MYSLKRRREDDEQEDQKSKKPKEDKKAETIGRRLESAAEQLKEFLQHLKTLNQDELVRNTIPGAVEHFLMACDTVLNDPVDASEELIRLFNHPLRPKSISDRQGAPTGSSRLENWLALVEQSTQEVSAHLNELYRAQNAPPSASTYANTSHWHYWQDQKTAVFNLRPKKNQGLPLCILHPVFARFVSNYGNSLPNDSRVAIFDYVAHTLCSSMSEKFTDDTQRTARFLDDIEPLLSGFETQVSIVSNHRLDASSSQADVALDGIILGQIKHEASSGDPYMHISRCYQAQVHNYLARKVRNDGFPHLLICILGPILFVSGGFLDGEQTIVEPLTEPCLMLPDYLERRQRHLARILYATTEAFESLKLERARLFSRSSPGIEGTPRIYPSFSDFKGQSHTLKFVKRLDSGYFLSSPQNLLFLAKSSMDSNIKVLVKLVKPRHYGIDVHRILAQSGLAPDLFGRAEVEGSFTAIVMEYLDPSHGWATLFQYAKTHRSIVGQSLHPQLIRLLEVMKEKKVVH
ncbi:hypothetical protein CPB86DRAFT_822985, partial [Serendipita vermifera]